MARITTVIFDVFETLVPNRTESWIATFQDICRVQGLPVPHLELWQQWKARELNFRRVRVDLKDPEKSPPFKSYQQAWTECFQETFQALGLAGDPAQAAWMCVESLARNDPYPDAWEALPVIQKRWRTGVFSNADDAYLLPIFQRNRLRFDAVLSSESARVYKPHPGAFRKVLERLGVGPDQAIYVGDNPLDDVFGAKGVGMRVAWINRNGALPDPAMPVADYTIHKLTELPGLLESM